MAVQRDPIREWREQYAGIGWALISSLYPMGRLEQPFSPFPKSCDRANYA